MRQIAISYSPRSARELICSYFDENRHRGPKAHAKTIRIYTSSDVFRRDLFVFLFFFSFISNKCLSVRLSAKSVFYPSS